MMNDEGKKMASSAKRLKCKWCKRTVNKNRFGELTHPRNGLQVRWCKDGHHMAELEDTELSVNMPLPNESEES